MSVQALGLGPLQGKGAERESKGQGASNDRVRGIKVEDIRKIQRGEQHVSILRSPSFFL